MEKYIKSLQRSILFHKIYGHSGDRVINMDSLEPDGRKRGAAKKALQDADYITVDGDKVVATDKAWNELHKNKPDLAATFIHDGVTHLKRPYVIFSCHCNMDGNGCLTMGNWAYVIEHPAEFNWVKADEWSMRNTSDPQLFAITPATIGDADATRQMKQRQDLFVTSPEFQAAFAETNFQEQLRESINKNLAWGLENIAGVPEKMAEKLTVSEHDGFFGQGRFTKNPEQWASQLELDIDSALQALHNAQERLTALVTARRAVEKLGGWDKFLELYKEAVAAGLRKHEAVEAHNAKVRKDMAALATVPVTADAE